MEVGKKYKTVGGWEALVIYITNQGTFYAIHAPGTTNESVPIIHMSNGQSNPTLSVGEPPRYGSLLPSDILLKEEIQ